MCARYTMTLSLDDLWEAFDLLGDPLEMGAKYPEFAPRYNIAPTQRVLLLASRAPRRPRLFRWGLVPHWKEDRKGAARTINARSETARSKPSFKEALSRRRCLVIADGFYEWKRGPSGSTPHYATQSSFMTFAGIWESHRHGDDVMRSTAILTRTAEGSLAGIHDRMPVILSPEERGVWMNEQSPNESIDQLLKAHRPPDLRVTEVTSWVNSVRNDGPECIRPQS